MQTSMKAIAQMPVQVVACKNILVAGNPVAEGALFTMPLEDYELASGDNMALADGEAERIQAAIQATRGEPQTLAQRRAEEAARQARNHAEISRITAAANARDAEVQQRRNALERLVDGALSMAGKQ
jgi:hypothetical protein